MNVLVVGSSLFDTIVSLENNPHITIENNKAMFSLGDKIPIDIKSFAIGGNAPNVASALKKLSVSSEIYTYLGVDPLSSYIKEQFEREEIKMYCEDTNSSNGPLSLIFDFQTDRTIFSSHPEFAHGFDYGKIETQPTHLYLTSIGSVWEDAYEKILSYASSHNISIAFSPGSTQMKNMNDTFVKTVHQSKMLFCNMEEARLILEKLSGVSSDTKELLLTLKNNGFELLSITDGANGAYAVDNNSVVYKIAALPPSGHEKTGAGDAYAGAFLAAYVEGKEISECMKWGVLNATGVMSKVGAHTGQLTRDEMEEKVKSLEISIERI
jgi:sugar/nucleoside kinase (ribokinase family)